MSQILAVGNRCPAEKLCPAGMTASQWRQHQKRENDPLILAGRAMRRKQAMARWRAARKRSLLTPLAIPLPGSNVLLFPSCGLRDMAQLSAEGAYHDGYTMFR